MDQSNRPRMTPRLKKGAVPTVFSFGPSPSPSKRKISTSENSRFDHGYSMATPPPTPVTMKPETTVNLDQSVIDSVITPPETHGNYLC